MTLREKIGRMFIIRPEDLIPGVTPEMILHPSDHSVTDITPEIADAYRQYPAGGILLFAHNCLNKSQLLSFSTKIKNLSGSPLLCIDEEGGRVARLARNPEFGLTNAESMEALCQSKGAEGVFQYASYIGSYLKKYGFDIDFAPVSDVNSNPDNPVIGTRSFSNDPQTVAQMVCSYIKGLESQGITACLKHFPGHGDTRTDSHLGYAESCKSWDDLLSCEIVPFKAGIAAGARMIMTAHITLPQIDGSNSPATLSSTILRGKLREELGYKDVIITDMMEMGAVSKYYSSAEATIAAINAGVDIVLGPLDYREAFDAVYEAVKSGKIKEERIDESIRRILSLRINPIV